VLAELVPSTAEALERDQRYVVTWDDSFYIGSQGYGLVSDLERLGFDVGVPNTWRVPVTHHRVVPFDEADGRVHLAVGAWVARWQAERGAVELASSDTRTDAEREQYERLRGRVIERLEAEGLDEVVPLVDGNLFGASLDPRLPDDVREGIEAMLELGSPGAVFLIPPDMAPLSLDG